MDNKIERTDGPELRVATAPLMERRGRGRIIEQAEEPAISFGELWHILSKRKWIIWTSAFVIFAVALSYTLLVTPKYRTTSIIEFNQENTDSLTLDERSGMPGGANAMDYTVIQRTQVNALTDDTLALQVVHDLNLESRKEFSRSYSPLDYFHSFPDESKLPLEKAPHRQAIVLNAFHKNLKVEPIPGTRMISIQFMDPDPDISARIVNSLVSNYTDQYFRIRYAATVQASDWLSQQLNDLKGQVESSQQKLADFQRQAGILGTDETHNIVMTRLQQIDAQLTSAQGNRILAQAVWQLAQTGNPELMPGLVNVSLSTSESGTAPTSLALVQNLRAQQNQLKMEYAETASKFGSAYPKLIELQSKLDEINANIQTEVANLGARAHNDFLASRQTEDGLRVAFEKAKAEANQQNDSAVQYTLLKHEAESRRNLYDGLSQKLKEAGVLASLRSSNIVVMDPARPSDRPARPIFLLNLGLGIVGGLLVGVVGAVVAENLDETISSPEQAEEVSQVSSLGFVPRLKSRPAVKKDSQSNELLSASAALILAQPRSHAAEAYRSLRTSIIQSMRASECNVLLVSSSFPDEGKTTTSINCAAAFAQQGLRVLLVEADLRRPKLSKQLNLSSASGLSSLISGGPLSGLPLKMPGIPTLSIIPAGPRSGYPAELLGSRRTKALFAQWRSEYDYIFIDSPPVLSVTDGAVLAPFCDGVIMVVRSGITTKKSLTRAMELFRRTQTRIVGTVLNAFEVDSADYRHYFGYTSTSQSGNGYYLPENN